MHRPSRWGFSFSKVIALVETPVKASEDACNQLQAEPDLANRPLQIPIHQGLLESASDFFSNAFKNEAWKEAKKGRLELHTCTRVLECFGNWLYNRELSIEMPWDLWIDIYVFACLYVVDKLASDTIQYMLKKLEKEPWIPSLEDIDIIYEQTSDDAPLRELAVICLAANMSSDTASILYEAHATFVRDFAVYGVIHGTSQMNRFRKRHGQVSRKCHFTGRIWFQSTVSFHLLNSSQPVILHSDICFKKLSTRHKYNSSFQVMGLDMLRESTLGLFAAWLYFNEDLQGEEHECQKCSDLHILMDCYEAALLLSRCEVEQIESADEVGEPQNLGFQGWLHSEALRFKDCVIKAMVSHCQRRGDVPSPEETSRLYSIATSGDPLRALIADVYIRNNKCSVLEVDNVEFQRELNARLINCVAGMREYIVQVQELVEPHKNTLDGERFYYGYSVAEQTLSRLAELDTPWPLQIDASMYVRKSTRSEENIKLEELKL